MSDYISREAAANREKIKTSFARIIVNNNPEKTYYNIMWWQDGEMHVGLGSANLSFVRKWLSEEFEVDSPAADVEPVRHGNWNIRRPRRSALCLVCSVCGRKVDTDAIGILLEAGEYGVVRRLYPYCHCGAKMDLEE